MKSIFTWIKGGLQWLKCIKIAIYQKKFWLRDMNLLMTFRWNGKNGRLNKGAHCLVGLDQQHLPAKTGLDVMLEYF
ncbi:MAG: hypothetical protein OXM61_16675 [Candidatus Poribacteria bacterium]|nr:hypothetical protein [Candidatus Poribacteria bacterium]